MSKETNARQQPGASGFTSPLRYENLDGERLRLTEAFVYRVGDAESTEIIRVPAGFECDGQSYPRLLWFVDHPQGKGAKAGFVHDYLYWLNGRPVPETGRGYDRKRADQIFHEALLVSGVGRFRAWVRFRALRLFGGVAWRKHGQRIEREGASAAAGAALLVLMLLTSGCVAVPANSFSTPIGTFKFPKDVQLEGLQIVKKGGDITITVQKYSSKNNPQVILATADGQAVVLGGVGKAAGEGLSKIATP